MSEGRNKQACIGSNNTRNIGYIEEVLADILCRLPAKQLADSKLVCNFWRKLIREPQFAQSHFSCSRERKYIIYPYNAGSQKNLYLMDKTGQISPYVTLPSVKKNSCLELICSFNGLLCFTKSTSPKRKCFTKSLKGRDLDIYICNPATREILQLPQGSPSTEPPSVGIIFEPNKIKYKVVRFFCDDSSESKDTTTTRYEIYSPGDVVWRVIDRVVEPPLFSTAFALMPTTICVGGRMYWLVLSAADNESGYVLSMDMDENITRIRLPEANFDRWNFISLFTVLIEYKGRLGFIFVDDDNDRTEFFLWLLENVEQESPWELEKGAPFRMDRNVSSINFIVQVENELLFVFRRDPDIFHFRNLEKRTWRLPGLADMCKGYNDCRHIRCKPQYRIREPVVFPYFESLLRCNATN